jgi:hypothetical protein
MFFHWNLTSARRFQSLSPFGVLSKVLTLLSFHLQTQVSKRVPARTPCGRLSNTSKYLILSTLCTSATTVLQLSPWLISSKLSTSLRTPCTASVLHLHFCWNENNGIPPELSEINSEPLSTHSLRTFHCTPCRNFSHSGRETIETHSLSLSDFKHST